MIHDVDLRSMIHDVVVATIFMSRPGALLVENVYSVVNAKYRCTNYSHSKSTLLAEHEYKTDPSS